MNCSFVAQTPFSKRCIPLLVATFKKQEFKIKNIPAFLCVPLLFNVISINLPRDNIKHPMIFPLSTRGVRPLSWRDSRSLKYS